MQRKADAGFYISRGIPGQRLERGLSFDHAVSQSGQGIQNLRIHVDRLGSQPAQLTAHFTLQMEQNFLGGFLTYPRHPGEGIALFR